MKKIQGNVCAPKGFKAAGMHCGVKPNTTKFDLAMIYSEKPCTAAGVFTQNLVKGAPVKLSMENLKDGKAQAIICNSGNANTCNANGMEIASQMCEMTGAALGISPKDVIVASTGVIGQPMVIDNIASGIPVLAKKLAYDGGMDAEKAIMTTDTVPKEAAIEFGIDGKTCKLGIIAKGSGMINPNMATMLIFVTTDCTVTAKMLKSALTKVIKTTINMITVDGDTSTNDTMAIMANGLAGNAVIDSEGANFDIFCEALHAVTLELSRKLAKDGEGATKLLECAVSGAPDWETAKICAKGVVNSPLVKAAMFGADANWGRVLCAIGYSGAKVDADKIDVVFKSAKGEAHVCKNGVLDELDEDLAKQILQMDEIQILVKLNAGNAAATAYGCDLTYDYVKINGDYRS